MRLNTRIIPFTPQQRGVAKCCRFTAVTDRGAHRATGGVVPTEPDGRSRRHSDVSAAPEESRCVQLLNTQPSGRHWSGGALPPEWSGGEATLCYSDRERK